MSDETDRAMFEVPGSRLRELSDTIATLRVALASRDETIRTMHEDSLAAVRVVAAERDRLREALENVRMLVVSRAQRFDPELAGHLLRFCAEAGVTGSILRATLAPDTARPVCGSEADDENTYRARLAAAGVPPCPCICHSGAYGCGASQNDHGECCAALLAPTRRRS